MYEEKLVMYSWKYDEKWMYDKDYLDSLSFDDLVEEVKEVKNGLDNSKNLEDKDNRLYRSMDLAMHLDSKYNLWLKNPIVELNVNDWKIEMSYEYIVDKKYIKIVFDENFAHKTIQYFYVEKDGHKVLSEIISKEDLPVNNGSAEEIERITSIEKASVTEALSWDDAWLLRDE